MRVNLRDVLKPCNGCELVGQALENAIDSKVADLQTAFAAQGIQISDADAKALLRSLNTNDAALMCLSKLSDAANALVPILNQLLPQVLQ
jgi:hypothetical protein